MWVAHGYSHLRYRPVMLFASAAICSGVPAATMRPPLSPPPGPMSITQSALAMTSRSCSMHARRSRRDATRVGRTRRAARARRAGAGRWWARRTRTRRRPEPCPFRWQASGAAPRRPKAPASASPSVQVAQTQIVQRGPVAACALLHVAGHGRAPRSTLMAISCGRVQFAPVLGRCGECGSASGA